MDNLDFTQDPNSKDPIYIKKVELGPHGERVVVISESPYHGSSTRRALIWGIAAIIVGISSMNFLFAFADQAKVAIFGNGNQNSSPIALSTTAAAQDSQTAGGSNDSLNVTQTDRAIATAQTATSTGQYYFLNEKNKSPRVSALAYAVADLDTGQTIISKNADMVLLPASVTKLLTSVIAEENMDQHQMLTVSSSALSPINTEGELAPGQKLLLTDILYPLLMESSNDAAEVIARNYKEGRTAYIDKMNKKALDIGMTNTSFVEPSGVSHQNSTTANDMLKLGFYIWKNHQDILDVTRVKQFAISGHIWLNGNHMMLLKTFLGGKNGFTDAAGETTLTFLNVQIGKFKKNIVLTILKSSDRKADADILLRFIENNMSYSETGNPDQ